ncbi:DUF5123 domain-containing protein [Chitinophaga silvisoli]|uniref:DUF5123 domain-containing protein n=2 Tax=Chitinophaga silvisoli TaxID=2291814 RepID=A0A3E1NYL9_9BACT|nr:DUF5123 domain-containing protein [Chitinophaga silvisoli]
MPITSWYKIKATKMIHMRYVIVFLFISLLACKKKEDELSLSRQFMPSGEIAVTTIDTLATLSWKAALFTAGTAVTYTVAISQDSTFATTAHTFTTDTTGIRISDHYLLARKKYYARVRTDGKDTASSSNWVYSRGFTLTGEQLLLPIADSNLIDKSVILLWKPTEGLTKLVFMTGGVERTIGLSAEQSLAAKLQVDSLQPLTTYTVEIFKGEQSKGILTFTTKAGVATGPNVIDLTGITGLPSILRDTLPKVGAGSIIILKRGETYHIDLAMEIGKAVSFVSENSFNTQLPLIYFTNNFNVTAGSVIDSIVFRGLTLRSNDYAARYVINAGNVATIGKILFEGCHVEIFRGVVRLQTGATGGTQVNDFVVNNCVVDSISNYGVLNVDNVACAVQNITIRNSTLYKLEKVVTSKQNSNAVVLSNCTFNEAPQGGGSAYLVDYSQSATNNVAAGITVKSCIIGAGRSNSGNTAVRGIRANAATLINVSSSYNTSDYVVAGNAIPGLTVYGGTVTDLWKDPGKGNFGIKDSGFAGKGSAGDPRWW